MSTRRDTPIDSGLLVMSAGEVALARLQQLETIESAYEAWRELVVEQRTRLAYFKAEYRRLDEHASLVLGAVKAAHGAVQVPPEGGLERFLSDSRVKLDAVRHGLAAQETAEAKSFENAVRAIAAELRARIVRQAEVAKPVVRVMLRSMPGGHRILHAERLSSDVAVTLFFVLTGRIPSHYGYLFDDSTDDAAAEPGWVYVEDGPTNARPPPAQLQALLEAHTEVWPLKSMIPLSLPGDHRLARWLQRGAVMEAEVSDGDRFRNLLTQDEAERFVGLLLKLKLEGKLELELALG